MKIGLKLNGQNKFNAYELRGDEKILIGPFVGSLKTVKRLIAAKLGHAIEVVRQQKEGWY
jgi:hypothetical protein